MDYALYLVKTTEYLWLSVACKKLFGKKKSVSHLSRRQASDLIEFLKENQLDEEQLKSAKQDYIDKRKN